MTSRRLIGRVNQLQASEAFRFSSNAALQRQYRLTRSKDVERVRRLGKSFAHSTVVLIALPNKLGQVRIGVLASRTIGGAVQRNRAKRLIRSALQGLLPKITTGVDIVLLARRPIIKVKSVNLIPIFETLMNEAKVI